MDEREVMGRQEFQIPEWLKRIQQLHFEQPDGIPLLVLYPTSKQHQEESRRLHQVLRNPVLRGNVATGNGFRQMVL